MQGFDKINNPKESLGQRFNDIDIPLGVKATVGDFDGDGYDDIAVLRVMLQYTEQYKFNWRTFSYSNFVFGAFVDWYTFDYGSMKPKYYAHPTNYGDNGNGWVGIRTTGISMPFLVQAGIKEGDTSQANQNKLRMRYFVEPITGSQVVYSLIDHEFDIIAGKFTGTVGKIMPRDDLIIKYPQWTNSSGNKLRSHVALMTNIPGTTNATAQVHEITSVSERSHKIAFAKADFLDESVSLGDPERVIDTSEHDYTAILQMFPYHVDNISADGTALIKDPHNFTLRFNTEVKYNNTTSGSETKNLTYSMIKTAETIFSIDNKTLRNITKTFKGVRKLANAVLGNNAKVKKMESIGKIWDQLKDTVETTTSRSNENATSYTMSITTAANYQDTLYMNESTQYIYGVTLCFKFLLRRGLSVRHKKAQGVSTSHWLQSSRATLLLP